MLLIGRLGQVTNAISSLHTYVHIYLYSFLQCICVSRLYRLFHITQVIIKILAGGGRVGCRRTSIVAAVINCGSGSLTTSFPHLACSNRDSHNRTHNASSRHKIRSAASDYYDMMSMWMAMMMMMVTLTLQRRLSCTQQRAAK